ncbi:MAG: hypothetical protein JST65_16000 [Acidobacteria bacterium]|nr:hypothetical protein [Acidobacteriota bacterium]
MIEVKETGDRQLLVTGGDYRLLVPLDYGPRVMSLTLGDGPNLFQVLEGEDPNAELRIRGGHRLWVAPERKAVTWVDDNQPVEIEQVEDYRLIVRGGREARTGLIKEMAIEIDRGVVCITHQVYNTSHWRIELAPWALTIMNPGGWAIAPFPPRGKHPVDLAPSNPLVMWPYTDLSDARWKFHEKCFTLRQDSSIVGRPQKIGSFAEDTWCAYVWNGYVFRKRSQGYDHMDYPDMGCSFELFSNHEMLELETLSPIVSLDPGECVRHEEEWTVERVAAAQAGTPEAPGSYFGL